VRRAASAQAPLGEPVLPDIDVCRLVERESEAQYVVVEESPAHAETFLRMQHVSMRHPRLAVLSREAIEATKVGLAARTLRRHLTHQQRQRHLVTVHDVPGVGGKLVVDALDEARSADQRHVLLAPEHDAQPVIETCKVIDMRVADERIRDP